MRMITTCLLFGLCIGLVWSEQGSVTNEKLKIVSNQTACLPNKVDLTIAIDNSVMMKNEIFQKVKKKVKEIVGNIVSGYKKFRHSIAIHSFGDHVYEDEIKFNKDGPRILSDIDKLEFKGTDRPRMDASLRHANMTWHYRNRLDKTHIYLYIGDGYSDKFAEFDKTMRALKKEHPYLHVVGLYTDENFDEQQENMVFKWMSHNKHSQNYNYRNIDDDVFDIVRDIYLGVHCNSKIPQPNADPKVCGANNIDLTIAIDNSKSTSRKTFQKVKDKVQDLLEFKTMWYKKLGKRFKYAIAIHTFGSEVYQYIDLKGLHFTRDVTKMVTAMKKMPFHGEQEPRMDASLDHTEQSWNKKYRVKKKHLYVYIGNGYTQYFYRLWDKLNQLRQAYPHLYFLMIYTDDDLDSRQKTLLEWIAGNKFRVKSIDDTDFNIVNAIDMGIECLTE